MSPSPIRRCLSLLVLLLVSGAAQAVDYTFSTFGTSTPCTGSWSRIGPVFTCSGRVTLASGDTLSVNSIILSDIRVVALNGFSLTNNVIGSGAGDITLESDYGSIVSSGTNSIRGSVQSNSGPISLSGTTVTGSVSGNGSVSLTGGQVSGNVSGAIGVTTTGAVINGTLTASSGSVNLTGGSVGGLVRSGCCTVTTNGTNLLGGARSDSAGLQITGGTIRGDFYANNNTAAFSGVTMLSGSVTGASTATFSNSSLGTGLAPVTVTTVSGAVTLDNSVAFGTFTAPGYSTIFVSGSSTVTGTCLPNSTPANACQLSPCLNDERFDGPLKPEDWTVTSRSGSFGLPRVVNGRLRLTDNSGNVSTGATIQRLVPAAGNLVQIDFKYYAYNGSGADGVAVIFSDASVTPQPGGYGGSLGYAQLNATSGFAGGWLGIALDEFGNFSNPTEGRVGGPGLRQDAVAIRGSGSGTSGYRYLRGTAANLNPGIDVATTAEGPGHTYRIILDSRTSGRTLVSVLRNTGSGFVTLIAPFDAQAEAGQAALPANFLVTFTGSTGGSTNIHELDDLSFCAERIGFIGQQIDHFRLTYSGEAVTCSPQPVQISACLNADCSLRYTDPVSVTLAPASGWSAVAPASLSGSVLTFSGGTASAFVRQTTVGVATLGVGTSTPATKAFSVPVCSTPGCQINYRESGLLVDVPTLTSARPETGAEVRAVRSSDNALVCIPHFANVTRTLQFTSAYRNPGTGTQPVVVNGTNVGAAAVAVPLSFDASGVARMTVRYDDAGEMRLNASYSGSAANGDSGLSMSGTDDFVVKPYGLCLQTDASCSSASPGCAVFPNGVRAGDSFPLRIRAVGWQSDTEPLTAAALCDNLSTPNFQLANIALSSAVAAPIGGDNGVVAPNTYSHVLGATTTTQASVSEVGVFTISATPGNYLGVPMSGGTSGFVGRFVPAYLGASGSASLTPACGAAFSYQGQWIGFAANREPSLTVSAYNRAGAITRNYDRPGFWKLNEPTAGSYAAFSDTSELALHGDPAWAMELAARNARVSAEAATSAVVSGAEDGDGSRTYRWPGQRLMYQATSQPTRADAPFLASVRQQFSAAQLREVDGGYEVCVGSGSGCQDFSYDFVRDPGSEIRLGRLSLGNAHGSELQGLSLPLRIESWRDGAFQLESGDSCSAPLLGDPAPVAGTFTGNLATGETAVTRSGPSAGVGQILLSAPGAGNDGSVQVQLPGLPDWLLYDWNGTGRQSPRGLASFGIYQGSPPLIFRRELYR